MDDTNQISDDARAAIDALLSECRKKARPFAGTEGAIKGMSPMLPDARLVSAGEAAGCSLRHGDRRKRSADVEDECEALAPGSVHHQYGRRIETDGSWTIYHVFTGTPARICGHSMAGLSRPGATEIMTFLNVRNEKRRKGQA